MTPLAHRIVKELTLPLKDRTFNDGCGLLKRMSDIHCFDLSDFTRETKVGDTPAIVRDLWPGLRRSGKGTLAFLPAQKTWIEWRNVDGLLQGFLLERSGDTATVRGASGGIDPLTGSATFTAAWFVFQIPLDGHASVLESFFTLDDQTTKISPPDAEDLMQVVSGYVQDIYVFLALINTPRIIGRVTRNPHKGLERALLARRGSVGHWPLHAWHEIKLSITPPDAQPSDEGHLTGKRALHFVRQHMRVRMGKVEMVSEHWRGDAQIGIKRARYAVTH